MNGSYAFIRAVRGPLLLIVLGVLFAMDHMGGWEFERTWPVLIILVGVWKLIEYLVVRQPVAPPYGPPPPPAGGFRP